LSRQAPTLEDLRAALRSRALSDPTGEGVGRAAVAAVLRPAGTQGPELLFIRRAEHPLDPWSGHIAFPGGRLDPEDTGPLQAAVRETLEEVGLDLDREGELLGSLSPVPVTAGGQRLPMVIEPFVFELTNGSAALPLFPNHEVEEILWVPISFLADQANRSTLRWYHGGRSLPLPCCRYRGRVIWGLTLGMVDELLARAG
jgi:8-oxo-dGTP pyrophosphatase MutT (NUDIX family)